MIAKLKHLCLSLAVVIFFGVCLWSSHIPSAQAQAVSLPCSAPNKIDWPANNPVWSFCWAPPDSSSGVDGSGLELSNVYYKGKKVLEKAHIPVLNVKYDPGGCGGTYLSYRDWVNQLVPFEANNELQPGYAEPTVTPRTVCNTPGSDIGSFSGVAVEKKPDQLILTTQMRAGWYRYTQKWIFLPNGTIQPKFGFTAVVDPCTSKPHNHHVYWRFDFDIEGSDSDKIDEFNTLGWNVLGTETSRNKRPISGRKWRIVDKITNRGFEVIPGANDGVADAFAVADVWALRSKSNEIDDGGAVSGSDQAQMNRYLNSESLDGQDNVLWYHAFFRHSSGIGCEFVGPTLKPVGNW